MENNSDEDHVRQIEALVSEELRIGHFTHAFVECGSISDGPLYSRLWSTNGRSIFDLASLTKAIVTTPLAFLLTGDRKFNQLTVGELLSDQTRRFLSDEIKRVTIWELLRHQSGLPAWRNFWLDEQKNHSWEYHMLCKNQLGQHLEN